LFSLDEVSQPNEDLRPNISIHCCFRAAARSARTDFIRFIIQMSKKSGTIENFNYFSYIIYRLKLKIKWLKIALMEG
jgi:hypothetical protein